jgi:hypothetical protein
MSIDAVLAGVPVADFDAGSRWSNHAPDLSPVASGAVTCLSRMVNR